MLATAAQLAEAIGYTLGITITATKTREAAKENKQKEAKARVKAAKSMAKQGSVSKVIRQKIYFLYNEFECRSTCSLNHTID